MAQCWWVVYINNKIFQNHPNIFKNEGECFRCSRFHIVKIYRSKGGNTRPEGGDEKHGGNLYHLQDYGPDYMMGQAGGDRPQLGRAAKETLLRFQAEK